MRTELFKCEAGNTKTVGHFMPALNRTCSKAFVFKWISFCNNLSLYLAGVSYSCAAPPTYWCR